MTTPPSTPDPFATPSGGQTPPPPGAEFAAAPSYAPPAYSPIVVKTRKGPSSLAMWVIVLTGLVTAATLALAAVTGPGLDAYATFDPANPEFGGALILYFVVSLSSFLPLIASYVVLALWMSRVRAERVLANEPVGGPPAVEWWGWFVPLGNLVLPYLGMRAITRNRVSVGILLGWWLPWIASSIASAVGSFTQQFAVDPATGIVSKPELLDVTVTSTWIGAVLTVISWVFLVLIVRTTTATHKAA